MPTLPEPPDPRGWRTCFIALCVTLVAPLLLVDVPPLLDYPNHLARMVVLAHPADPILQRFYQPHWAIIPDLGIDLVLPPLLRFLPVHVVGRLALAMIVLLPVFGTIAYNRVLLGRPSWFVLGVGLVAWNQAILLGFLNFTAGIGFGFLLAAAWIAWRERYPVRAVALAIAGAVGLFFCHLMGLICYALLIGPFELVWLWHHRGMPNRVLARIAAASCPFILPALLYATSPLGHMAGEPEFLSPAAKLAQILVPFQGYVLSLDLATAACLAIVLLVSRVRTTQVSGLTLGLLAMLFLASPFEFQGVANLDTRFVVMIGFMVFGGLRVALPRAAALLLVAAFGVRMAVLATVWTVHGQDLAQLRAAIAPVPAGSAVYVAAVSQSEAPDYWAHGTPGRLLSNGLRLDTHMPALLVIEHRAWWPFLFDNESQQPVRTRQPYRDLATTVGGLPDAGMLPTADLCGFDYVLLMEAGGVADLDRLAAGRLTLLTQTDFAALFRVDPARCKGG